MGMFGKAKEIVTDAKDKVVCLAESTKDAITSKVTFKVIDTTGLDAGVDAGYLEKALNDLLVQNKTVEVTGVGGFCIVKLTN